MIETEISEVTAIKRTISAMSGDGVVAHNRRTYIAENVDPARTHLNIEYCYTPIEEAYHELFDEALAEFNAKTAVSKITMKKSVMANRKKLFTK